MANGEDITTKFKVDISDLKAGITEANKQIKLANAEFKAASAGMDDWQKSSDGIKAKLTQLSSVLVSQNTKLQNYKKQLEEIESTESKNAKRADELKAKLQQLANQGVSKTSDEYKKYKSALNDVEKEQLANKTSADNLRITILNQQAAVNATEKDIRNYTSSLDTLDSESAQAESATSKLTGGFTVMKGALASLVADGIRAGIQAMKDFTGSMIESAAAVKAENSMFSQTFGDLESTATSAIKRVADTTGILESRLKTTGAQIYAFAMANGATAPEALALMESSLMAAADNAAYYDKSLDESAETMMSFLKGNYANDAALGTSATEFTRNAKAVELFGTKYNDLTEIQKQQTLLKMVTDSQAAAGAMGQAARESDGWENVLGNLSETWRQFQAQVGTPFLEALIPVIQSITARFTEWRNSVDWEAFGASVKGFADKVIAGFGWIIDNGPIIISVLAGIVAGFAAFKIVSTITSLIGSFKLLFSVLKNGQGIMAALNAVMAANPIGLVIAVVAGLVAGFITLWNTSEQFRNFWIGLWENVKKVCSTAVNAVIGFFKSVGNFVSNISNSIATQITNAITNIKNLFTNIKNWVVTNIAQPIANFYNKWIAPVVNKILEVAAKLAEMVIAIFIGLYNLLVQKVITPIINKAQELLASIKSIFAQVTGWFNNNVITPVKDAFSSLFSAVGNFASDSWEKIKDVFSKVGNFFTNAFKSAFDGIKKVFSPITSFFSGIWSKIKDTFSGLGTKIGNAIGGAVKTAINGVIRLIENTVNGAINLINGAIDAINTLPGVEVSKVSKLNLPRLERGIGIAKKGKQYLLEGKGNEAVVPLDRNKYWIRAVSKDMLNQLQNSAAGSLNGSANSVTNSNVNNFTQNIYAPKQPSRIELYRDSKNLLNLKGVNA